MKRYTVFLVLAACSVYIAQAQQVFTLDDFRKMALDNNKNLKIRSEQINAANSMKKAAATQYLPNFSATGAYFRNSDNISLLSEDKYAPVGTVMPDGSFGFVPDQVYNKWTSVNGQPVPLDANGQPFNPHNNPEKIEWKGYAYLPKEEFTIDNQNIFAGTITMFQPIFLGGKIRELNKIAGYTKKIAEAKQDEELSEVLYSVDAAYWQVVSVSNKLKLATDYKKLIEHLNSDVDEMVKEGFATQSDRLKVKVKLNEADLNMIKAENGLSLSKMLLCELSGMPLDTQFAVIDENIKMEETTQLTGNISPDDAYENRSELKQLKQAINLSHSNVRLQQSRFLPNIGLTANYLWTNPNPFNGFENELKGSWNIGVAVTIPIFHWGERVHTLNAAKAEYRASQYKMEDAKEKIGLQVQQASYKINEANRRLSMTNKNVESAGENLRVAEEGFKEGIITLSNYMEAQVAWQSANSERIDAAVDSKLCRVYLQKALGTLTD